MLDVGPGIDTIVYDAEPSNLCCIDGHLHRGRYCCLRLEISDHQSEPLLISTSLRKCFNRTSIGISSSCVSVRRATWIDTLTATGHTVSQQSAVDSRHLKADCMSPDLEVPISLSCIVLFPMVSTASSLVRPEFGL